MPSIDALAKFSWDIPFRFFASLLLMLGVFAYAAEDLERPSDGTRAVAAWAGADISRHTGAVSRWFQDTDRIEILSVCALYLLAFGLAGTFAWARRSTSPLTTRAAPTVVLTVALLQEMYGQPATRTVVQGAIVWGLLGLVVLYIARRSGFDLDELGFVSIDLLFSAIFAVFWPLAWLLLMDSRSESTRTAEAAATKD